MFFEWLDSDGWKRRCERPIFIPFQRVVTLLRQQSMLAMLSVAWRYRSYFEGIFPRRIWIERWEREIEPASFYRRNSLLSPLFCITALTVRSSSMSMLRFKWMNMSQKVAKAKRATCERRFLTWKWSWRCERARDRHRTDLLNQNENNLMQILCDDIGILSDETL